MKRIIESVCWGLVILSLLISLFAPVGPVTRIAGIVAMVGIVVLVCIAVVELICVFCTFCATKPRPTWRIDHYDQAEDRMHRSCPRDCASCMDDEDCADDLVDGTAAGLINWSD